MLAVILLFCLGSGLSYPLPYRLPPFAYAATTPTIAAEVVCQLGRDMRLFNNHVYGSYLPWACPTMPLFIDTRFELYPTEMWQDYLASQALGMTGTPG